MHAVPVFMNHGRWIARCPRPGCLNAEAFGRCDDGSAGGLTGVSFTCRRTHGGCGLQAVAEWPENIESLERLLLVRPALNTRNWTPGEDPADILRENIAHGILPNSEMTILGGRLFVGRELPVHTGGNI